MCACVANVKGGIVLQFGLLNSDPIIEAIRSHVQQVLVISPVSSLDLMICNCVEVKNRLFVLQILSFVLLFYSQFISFYYVSLLSSF